MLFKGREGGAREGEDPQTVQSQLSSGHSLDGGVKSRMESAFGMSFSNVRIHTDATAQGLSDSLNARAFTIGGDIAFGSGEYQPGTPIGDALIAHELAHVVQQGGSSSSAPMQKGGAEYNTLEEDADVSAVGAVASMWSGAKGALKDIGKNAMPRMRSGLGLQRCKDKSKDKKAGPDIQTPALRDYNDKDEMHDPSKLTDAEIEATDEFKSYMDPKSVWQSKHKMTKEQALLACRLALRHMREGKAVNWSADAEVFMNLARSQLGTLKETEKLVGKLEWVGSSESEFKSPSTASSDFAKWLLAGGPEPTDTGKMNCWEMILFGAFQGGIITKARIQKMYEEAAKKSGMDIPAEIEKNLCRGSKLTFDPADPKSPEPLPGDIVIFNLIANHAAISLGTKDASGKHEVISHWFPPDHVFQVKKTTIEDLLPHSGLSKVKFCTSPW